VWSRRHVLGALGAAVVAFPRVRSVTAQVRAVETVAGTVPSDRLGVTLVHEHVLVDFIGASEVSPSRYNRDTVFRKALPFLRQAHSLGCRTLVECTPAYLGRDPLLLKRLSDATGLNILTNTGYYGAANDKFVPAHAFNETAEQLAARWIAEARNGIAGTGIKPAFMKIGVDSGPLSDIDSKLVAAAARTHLVVGLPVWSHTGDGAAALAQVALFKREGMPLHAFVWVHAQNERDPAVHQRVAEEGAWISFDGISPDNVDHYVDLVVTMRAAECLDRVLVSHDAGWYHVGEPNGGMYRPYDTLFTAFLPRLRARGFSEAQIQQLLIENPRRALTAT
jgi:predicted metal-dependent phosphotriesterase family hydrolase